VQLIRRIGGSSSLILGVSYQVIFEHFGSEAATEDSTIRYLSISIGFAWGG